MMHPGYVRVVIDAPDAPRARAACRRFASCCREEDARRGLIVAGWAADLLEWDDALAASGAGFKLAVVGRGARESELARLGARRSVTIRLFRSEHQAAAWLMR